MVAKDVMKPHVNSIDENDSVLLAVFKMKELDVGALHYLCGRIPKEVPGCEEVAKPKNRDKPARR